MSIEEAVALSRRFRLVFAAPTITALPVGEAVALRAALVDAERWDDLSDEHQAILIAAESEVS